MADGSAYLDTATARPLTVVGFAGGGGSSVAIKLALGTAPDLAMNHWLTAVLAHQRHFPETEHHCADIFDVDPRAWRPGEKIGFAWFSPDCTDFSKAKGKAPRSERIRGLAWSILPWLVARRPDVTIIENVEEFEQAGPVYRTADDWRANGVRGTPGEPIKALRGQMFQRLVARVHKMGGTIEWRVINAADFGAPTTRKRIYVIIRLDGKPIVWPARTHAPRKDAAALGLLPWRGACEIIDWSQDCPSIFLTPDEVDALRRETGKRVQRPLVAATLKRVARGLERYVIGSAEPFIVPCRTHGGGGNEPRTACAPLRTITATKRGEFAAVDPTLAMISNNYGSNTRGGRGDPRDPTKTLVSANHSAVVTAHLAGLAHGEHAERAGSRVRDIADPINTVAAGGGDAALVTGALVRTNFHSAAARNGIRDVEEPTATATGDGGIGLTSAYLVRQFGEGGPRDVTEPDGAVMPGVKTQVVSAFMAQGNQGQLGRAAEEPFTTFTSRATQQQLIAAHLGSYYGVMHGSDAADPSLTATGKDRHALTAAWLEQANTDMVGHELPAPVSTIVGKGCTQRLIEARLELDGGGIGRRASVLAFLWSHFGMPTPEEWSAPAATLEGRKKFGLVMVSGQVWMIVDIGLRMLTPRELAGAMGLPSEYDLTVDATGRPVSKTHQTQMIGNMVSPPPAAALIAANCADLIADNQRRAA